MSRVNIDRCLDEVGIPPLPAKQLLVAPHVNRAVALRTRRPRRAVQRAQQHARRGLDGLGRLLLVLKVLDLLGLPLAVQRQVQDLVRRDVVAPAARPRGHELAALGWACEVGQVPELEVVVALVEARLNELGEVAQVGLLLRFVDLGRGDVEGRVDEDGADDGEEGGRVVGDHAGDNDGQETTQ